MNAYKFVTYLLTHISQQFNNMAVICAGTTEGVMDSVGKARQTIHLSSAKGNSFHDFTFIACVPESINSEQSEDRVSEEVSHLVYVSSSKLSMAMDWRIANSRIGSFAEYIGRGQNNVSLLVGGGLGSTQEIARKIAIGEQVVVLGSSGRLAKAIATTKAARVRVLKSIEDQNHIFTLGTEMREVWLEGNFTHELEATDLFGAIELFDNAVYPTQDEACEAFIAMLKKRK
jgi:hypothetical protein